jgi:pilus assembly protein CpaB
MRGNRVFAVLAAAVVLGLASSFMVWRVINRPVALQASEETSDMIQVVAAAVDLPMGTLMTEEKLKLVGVGDQSLPPGYFTDKQALVGRGVVVPMVANEAILESKLAPQGAGAGLPTVIPEGMRGVSVKVDEVVGVAGFVLPGTRVDVLVTVEQDEADDDEISVTKLVLQNVQVLAAGESIQKDDEGKPQKVTVITLLVNPEDAEKLTLAATEGQIQLALRNVLDQDSVSTGGQDIESLVTTNRRAAPAPPPAPSRRVVRKPAAPRSMTNVEMYRGTEKEVKSF